MDPGFFLLRSPRPLPNIPHRPGVDLLLGGDRTHVAGAAVIRCRRAEATALVELRNADAAPAFRVDTLSAAEPPTLCGGLRRLFAAADAQATPPSDAQVRAFLGRPRLPLLCGRSFGDQDVNEDPQALGCPSSQPFLLSVCVADGNVEAPADQVPVGRQLAQRQKVRPSRCRRMSR